MVYLARNVAQGSVHAGQILCQLRVSQVLLIREQGQYVAEERWSRGPKREGWGDFLTFSNFLRTSEVQPCQWLPEKEVREALMSLSSAPGQGKVQTHSGQKA